ncbi:8976_t:CDS:10 [Entrophospora sp. SA101]|nr:15642_t:CDS:10 [Entrophospora sp. SA101]CAJ0766059.1 8976_t:CDS:10 [Entrophospora sp. SA101]CAJ0835851.1 13686_t:CDS:10 [Entrophospora sp. SA101]CAJ0844214.1 2487_t:CDS:10 [Entrophospora sp. SA101]CAJ0863074.1 863_t:CDS:10 [Entrophospora sp. SA101]
MLSSLEENDNTPNLSSDQANVESTVESESGFSGSFTVTTTKNNKEKEEVLKKVTENENEDSTINSNDVLLQLVSMGFEQSIAETAINENKGLGFESILQWLLDQKINNNKNVEETFEKENNNSSAVPLTDDDHDESQNIEKPARSKPIPYRRPISTANAKPPQKGILKPAPQPSTRSTWRRDWFAAFQNVVNVTATTTSTASSSTAASFFSNTLKREQVSQLNNENLSSSPNNNNLLTPKTLKRVRFSVNKLTNEHPHSPIPGDSDNSDWEEEYDFHEWSNIQNPINQQLQPKSDQKTSYSAKDIMQFYLSACKIREEFPVDRLVDILRKANQQGGSLKVIDLTGDIIDRNIAEPIADVLTLEFGLEKLILESLLVNDKLAYLNLANNRRIRSNGFNYIAIYIKKSTTLTYLDLSGTNIDKKSATFLAQALTQGNSKSGAILKTLKLDNCALKNNVLEVLGPGIRRSNLHYLSLKFNNINHVGAVWIGVMLRDYDDFNWTPNNPSISVSTMPAFNEQEEAKAERSRNRRQGLEVLDVSGNDLKGGIQYIAQALRRNRSLKELYLLDNRIDSKGLLNLADGFKYNYTLELLDISRNNVGGFSAEGIISLRNSLSVNDSLKKLILSDVNLMTEGAIALAEYLPETRTLTHLDLTSNPGIDIAGLMALAVSIKMNHSVRVLDVNVQPNDAEMSRLSRDILRACVRNTELAQKGDTENGDFNYLLPDFETKSFSGLSNSFDEAESSETGLGIYLDDLKKDIKIAEESLSLLKEMMQLYDECKNLQTKITPYLSSVIEKNLLEKLLILNDNLSTTLQKYDEMYNKHKGKSITVTLSKEPKVPEAPSDSNTSSNDQVESADSNNSSTISHTIPISTPISQTTLLPKTTSSTEPFSIIDSEDDE